MVGIGPRGKGRRDMQERNAGAPAARLVPRARPPDRSSTSCRQDEPPPPAYQDAPVVADYFRHCEEERQRRRGEWGRLFGSPGTVFPNISPHAAPAAHDRGVAPARPAPDGGVALVPGRRDAPAEVKDFLRHYYIRYSGPAGLTEQDDMENWNYAHAASRGTIARRYPYNYEMGLGRRGRDFE